MAEAAGREQRGPVTGAARADAAAGSGRPAPTRRGFWTVAVIFGIFLAAASAPSPLYALYAADWGFGPTTLTEVFAVYAVALLATLLVAGSVSDAVGRRPVILVALVVQVLAMLAFVAADGVGWLVAARALQGVATGLATGAFAAALLDLQPGGRPGLGALVNAVTPTVGLAAGALVAGALVEYGPAQLRLVYLVLLVAFVLCALALARVTETVIGRRRVDLRPRVGVAPEIRPAFLAGLPALVAPWALGGLYLSLGPSLFLSIVGSDNRLAGASVIVVIAGCGGLASYTMRARPPRTTMLAGCAALVVGVLVTAGGIAASAGWLFLVGTAIAGLGFGAAFFGAFRTLAGLADPSSRAKLVSSVYVAAYLAFAIPAVLAGFAAARWGLHDTAVGYALVVAVVAAVAIPLTLRTRPGAAA
ncbi:MAG: MFS transporter [Frankiales bacterium]|nr:MFS transporter [Frankiales bacterium]